MQESDYRFIQRFNQGYRLPYSKYDQSYITSVLQHKKNNAAAIVVCLDALTNYVNDRDIATRTENINMLFDEIAAFCINGLFGIGFYGVSVENGFPVRVDSCGENITKKYRSVYRNMSPEEYAALDRIESMTLDQREERKFRQYVLKYKYALLDTLDTLFEESDFASRTNNREVADSLALDQMFCSASVTVGRADPRSSVNVWSSQIILDDLRMLLAPHRVLLKRDDVAIIDDYTIADLKPVGTSEITRYKPKAAPSGEINRH